VSAAASLASTNCPVFPFTASDQRLGDGLKKRTDDDTQ
jgi:hypothetical protein